MGGAACGHDSAPLGSEPEPGALSIELLLPAATNPDANKKD